MPTAPIYHLALASAWDESADEYRGSTIDQSLAEVGFVHGSTAGQVKRIADLFYRDRDDVVLLRIDPRRLNVPVRFEADETGERFPHIYGPVPKDAVVSATRLPRRADGYLDLGDLT
jgi:glutathione S-transferase